MRFFGEISSNLINRISWKPNFNHTFHNGENFITSRFRKSKLFIIIVMTLSQVGTPGYTKYLHLHTYFVRIMTNVFITISKCTLPMYVYHFKMSIITIRSWIYFNLLLHGYISYIFCILFCDYVFLILCGNVIIFIFCYKYVYF